MGIRPRILAVWCPDWPVAASGHPQDEPVAVVAQGRVRASSEAARAEGVSPGLRRRQAESRCPGLVVVEDDPARDARAFEPVAAAVETVAPAVEVLHPGACVLPARGPSRYYGSDRAVVDRVARAVEHVTGPGGCRVGIADGVFAACQAARLGEIVPSGATPGFLAELPVGVLDVPDVTDQLRRLGLRTLGTFAALPPGAVTERFGPAGSALHRLARGLDPRPILPRRPPPDLAVSIGFDPPAERLDVVLFAARQVSGELADRLQDQVLACTVVAIQAETTAGRRLVRRWRHEDGLTPDALAERVRWQIEAWLRRSEDGPAAGGSPVEGGLVRLVLSPELVHAERGRQLAFWGERPADGRAARALVRIQGMVGGDGVVTAVVDGGRTPAARVRLIPWGGSAPEPAPSGRGAEPAPWPGRIPPPAPATVYPEPPAVTVTDVADDPLTVDGRGEASAPPARLRLPGKPPADVVAWAGPWPADERWWDPADRSRRARLQVLASDGTAHLVAFQGDHWLLEATYD